MGFPASCIYNEAGFILAVAADFASESHAAGSRKVSVCLQEVGERAWNLSARLPLPTAADPKCFRVCQRPSVRRRCTHAAFFYICVWDTRDTMSARLLARKHSAAWTPRPSAGFKPSFTLLLNLVAFHRVPRQNFNPPIKVCSFVHDENLKAAADKTKIKDKQCHSTRLEFNQSSETEKQRTNASVLSSHWSLALGSFDLSNWEEDDNLGEVVLVGRKWKKQRERQKAKGCGCHDDGRLTREGRRGLRQKRTSSEAAWQPKSPPARWQEPTMMQERQHTFIQTVTIRCFQLHFLLNSIKCSRVRRLY